MDKLAVTFNKESMSINQKFDTNLKLLENANLEIQKLIKYQIYSVLDLEKEDTEDLSSSIKFEDVNRVTRFKYTPEDNPSMSYLFYRKLRDERNKNWKYWIRYGG